MCVFELHYYTLTPDRFSTKRLPSSENPSERKKEKSNLSLSLLNRLPEQWEKRLNRSRMRQMKIEKKKKKLEGGEWIVNFCRRLLGRNSRTSPPRKETGRRGALFKLHQQISGTCGQGPPSCHVTTSVPQPTGSVRGPRRRGLSRNIETVFSGRLPHRWR